MRFGRARFFREKGLKRAAVFRFGVSISSYDARIRQMDVDNDRGAEVKNLRERSAAINLSDYAGVILAASVHAGAHEPEMVKFVKAHRAALEGMPAAFLSVTLSEAGAERTDATSLEHAQFVADVDQMIDKFLKETG